MTRDHDCNCYPDEVVRSTFTFISKEAIMPCLAVDFEWRHFLAGKVTAESTHDWLIFRDSSVKFGGAFSAPLCGATGQ